MPRLLVTMRTNGTWIDGAFADCTMSVPRYLPPRMPLVTLTVTVVRTVSRKAIEEKLGGEAEMALDGMMMPTALSERRSETATRTSVSGVLPVLAMRNTPLARSPARARITREPRGLAVPG